MNTNEYHIFETFKIENEGQGHGKEKCILRHSIGSQIFECVLLNFFIILALWQHMKKNEFQIF